MASIASVNEPGTGVTERRRDPVSDPDSAAQRLPGCDDFTTIVMATMAAYVVRALQFAAIAALGMGFDRQRLMAATHASAGWGGFSLWYGHGTAPLL